MQAEPAAVIGIRIVFAQDADLVWDHTISCLSKSTIRDVMIQSSFQADHPLIDLSLVTYGIFGKVQSADYVLQDGDRVEIYRSLTFDPKTSRRRRAIHRQKARNIKKKVPINDLTQ